MHFLLAPKRTFVLYERGRISEVFLVTKQKIKAAANTALARGERTRQAILKTAVDIASAEGLEGLTIGQLATKLSMSKSGLFAHFGSKEDLQLATVDAARSIFIRT